MPYQPTFFTQVMQMIAIAMEEANPVYNNRIYFSVPPRDTIFPVLVYQSQDLGGQNDDTIGNNGWQGLITLRSIDTTLSGATNTLSFATELLTANDNLGILVGGLPTLSGNYRVQFYPDKPIPLPVDSLTSGDYYTAGILVTVHINPDL